MFTRSESKYYDYFHNYHRFINIVIIVILTLCFVAQRLMKFSRTHKKHRFLFFPIFLPI